MDINEAVDRGGMRPDATRQALGAWAADKTREQIRAKAREWQVQANRLQADAAALQRRVVWLRRLARAAPGGREWLT